VNLAVQPSAREASIKSPMILASAPLFGMLPKEKLTNEHGFI